MMQQRLLASGADPGDLVQRIAAQRLGPACPMGLDREPVGLVAQSLEKVQHRVAPLQQERLEPGHEERSEEGRVGKECVSKVRFRGSPEYSKNNMNQQYKQRRRQPQALTNR